MSQAGGTLQHLPPSPLGPRAWTCRSPGAAQTSTLKLTLWLSTTLRWPWEGPP